MRQPQCADWCALHARHYPGPLCSGGITLHPRYYGPMRVPCGLRAASTLVSQALVFAAYAIHGWSTGPS